MFPWHTQSGRSLVFSLYFSINFSSPHQCCCGLIHSLYFSSRKKKIRKNHYLIWNVSVPGKKTGCERESSIHGAVCHQAKGLTILMEARWVYGLRNCRNTPNLTFVGLFRKEGGPKETICGLGSSSPLQDIIIAVTVAFQRKVHVSWYYCHGSISTRRQEPRCWLLKECNGTFFLSLLVLHNLPFSCLKKEAPWNSLSESGMASMIPLEVSQAQRSLHPGAQW